MFDKFWIKKLFMKIAYVWAVCGMIGLFVTGIYYLQWNGFGEQGEINFASVAHLIYNGYPLYVDQDFPARYSLQHGPLAFLIAGGFMQIFGADFFTAKLSGVLAIFLTVIISWFWFKKTAGIKSAFLLLGLEVWILFHWHHIYFLRPDSMLLFFTTVSVASVATARKNWVGILGLSIPLGMVINLKVHGLLYFIPIFVLASQYLNKKQLFIAGSLGILLSFFPYLLPQISLKNYLFFLFNSLNHGFSLANFIPKLVLILLLFLLPICFAKLCRINIKAFVLRYRLLLLSLIIPLLIVSAIASKGGSGTNHIMPFLPVVFYFYLQLILEKGRVDLLSNTWNFRDKIRPTAVVLTVIILLITVSGFTTQRRMWEQIKKHNHSAMLADLRKVQDQYRQYTMEIGYGEGSSYEKYRDLIAVPVFSGNPLYVEIVAMWDMQVNKSAIPAATIRSLEDGKIQVWLIPKGNRPFEIGGSPLGNVFDGAFLHTFKGNYVLEASSEYFDIWVHKSISAKQI